MVILDRTLNINHIRVIREFAESTPVKIGVIERYLVQFVSLPTAKKIMRQMIELGLVELVTSDLDKRVRLVKFLVTDIDELV